MGELPAKRWPVALWAIGLVLATLAVGVALDALLSGIDPPGVGAPPAAPSQAASAPAPSELTQGVPAQPVRAPGDEPDLAASVDAFLAGIDVQPHPLAGPGPDPRRMLLMAEHDQLSPVDLRLRLEEAIRRPPTGVDQAAEIAGLLLANPRLNEPCLFQVALALANRMSPGAARALRDGLAEADPRVRPHVVFALRGSVEPETEQLFVDLYAHDADPKVRAQAAFAIGERGERLPPLLTERARQVARAELAAEDPVLVQAAGDVLGTPPISADDRRLLERALRDDPDSARRLVALQALAMAQVPPSELRPVLEHVLADPRASDALREAARLALSQPAGPPAPGLKD